MPTTNHVPTPEIVVRALITLALLWQWPDVPIILVLLFVGMLRPGEALKLRMADFMLPSQPLAPGRAFVRIKKAKTRKVAGRLQHVRLVQPRLLEVLEAMLERLGPQWSLWRGTAKHFDHCHKALVAFFGISTEDGTGLTPASHRGGGATWLFEATESLDIVKWRGRWRADRTLDIYIQEVGALSVLPQLSDAQRQRIQSFACAADMLLASLAAALRR